MTHKPRKKYAIRNILKVTFCLERVLVLKSLLDVFLGANVQTHPVVNVAIHLDNVQRLDNRHSPWDITACFCFKHT